MSQSNTPFLHQPPPHPDQLDTDPRVFINPESDLPCYYDEDQVLWEWQSTSRCWFPVINESTLSCQQQVYEVPSNLSQTTSIPMSGQHVLSTYATSSEYENGKHQGNQDVEEQSMPLNLKRKLERKKFLEAQKKSKSNATHAKPNTSIYLSNLPPTLTLPSLIELCSKYGLLAMDPHTQLPKAKLYTTSEGELKGDALVTYYKEASVSLACQFLDDTVVEGQLIKVTPAEFQYSTKKSSNTATTSSSSSSSSSSSNLDSLNSNETKDLSTQEKDKLNNTHSNEADVNLKESHTSLHNSATKSTVKGPSFQKHSSSSNQAKAKLEKKLGWTGTEELRQVGPKPVPLKYRKMVLLKHMFTIPELENDPSLILDIKQEIRDECSKLGQVTNVVLYDKEPNGIVLVRFKDELSAAACIQLMNGRFYGGQSIQADYFDGTRYLSSSSSSSHPSSSFSNEKEKEKESEPGEHPHNEEDQEDEEVVRLQKYEAWLLQQQEQDQEPSFE